MKIWCFDDKQSNWGRMLFLAARRYGHDAELFGHPRQVTSPGYMFYRMEQVDANIQRGHALTILDMDGVIGIQKRESIMEYENKVYQTKKYKDWLPETYFVNQEKNASWTAKELGFPFISKSRSGSGSDSVHIVKDMDAAMVEADVVFNGGGLRVGRETQEGYLLWQKFLPDNEYSYRVVRIGNWYWMLRVFNRDDRPMSSGSGKFEPVIPKSDEEVAALDFAVKFISATQSKWVGVDVLFDKEAGKWRGLETTLAWNLHSPNANVDCRMFNKKGLLPKGHIKGAHQFEVLISELEKGAFDG